MIINHNMSALFTERNLKFNNIASDKDMEKLSSGLRINRMSDSPVDGAAAMRLSAELSANQQVGRNVDNGLATLGAADTTFSAMSR